MADKSKQQKSELLLPRRKLLLGGAAAVSAGLLVPAQVRAGINGTMCVPSGGGYGSTGGMYDDAYDDDFSGAVPEDGPGERRVKLTNPRTGESYDRVYVQDGQYVQDALEEYNRFCRDWRQNQTKNMDPGLLDIIWKLTVMLEVSAPWSLTSGYRSPATNSSLPGAAKQSYHMKGQANDLQQPERSPRAVYSAAMKIAKGGVGRYSSFTHVDTGPHRTWGG